MKENKLIKFLIPLVAAVVVFESIVLVTNLDKGTKVGTDNNSATESAEMVGDGIVEEPVVEFIFSTDTKEMKVGKTYKVTLNLSPKEDKMVDGFETYIKYDVENLKVANLISNNELQKPEVSKIDSEVGVIENIVLVDKETGLSIKSGELVRVLTFDVTPKTEGEYVFKLSTGDDDKNYATLIVENKTSNSLPWNGSELTINVIK